MNTLFHYCSTSSFLKIIQNKSIRLSSLRMSNDWKEGKLVNETFMRLVERDNYPKTLKSNLRRILDEFERMTDGFGFCLSRDGDLLSQWRGYADDGHGVSIGLSQSYLEKLCHDYLKEGKKWFGIHAVKYTEQEHLLQIEPTYKEIKNLIDKGAFGAPKSGLLSVVTPMESKKEIEAINQASHEAMKNIASLIPKLYTLKTFAFHEEKEVRLITLPIDDTRSQIEFSHRDDRIVPYIEYELIDPANAISVVKLGPRHKTSPEVVREMLEKFGFGTVSVELSAATYR